MASPLEALHLELIHHIVTFLEPRDIASLRLTCRVIESKASQGRFAAFFRRKAVQLTTGALQDMAQATSKGRLGCLLRDCTFIGIAQNGTTTPADEAVEQSRLLVEALRNLKQRSPKGGLASVSLRVAVRADGAADGNLAEPDDSGCSWRAVWDAALRTFNVTMAALDESQLLVEDNLDIFGSPVGCSLACHALEAFAQDFASTQIFRSLKKLTLSLSAPPNAAWTENQPDGTLVTDINAIQARYSTHVLQSMPQLLSIMPRLEILDLHWYNLGRCTSTPSPSATGQESSTMNANADPGTDTKHLKEISLRGIYVAETDLLQFLQTTSPNNLTLTDVSLVPGTYTSVFDYLTGQDSPVLRYHLDDLRERGALLHEHRLVHFDIPGQSKFRYIRGRVGPSTLTRRTDGTREPIRYVLPPGRAMGSGARMKFAKDKARAFGPPRDLIPDDHQTPRASTEMIEP